MTLGKVAVAATAAACMTMFLPGWSAQHGVSLSVDQAQAQEQQQKPMQKQAAEGREMRSKKAEGGDMNSRKTESHEMSSKATESRKMRSEATEGRGMRSRHVARGSERREGRVARGYEGRVARGYEGRGAYGERRVAHRYYGERRPGYAPGPVEAGADIAAGAVNTAGAVAAGAIGTAGAIAAAPFGEGPYAYAGEPGYVGPYFASSPWGDYECLPGTGPYDCKPYASKGWYHH